MAKKTVGKTAVKAATKPAVVPQVVVVIHRISVTLKDVPNVPDDLKDARSKVMAAIDRLANRVAANLAGAGKKADKDAAKKVRAEAKIKRDTAKKAKKTDAVETLRKKLAVMEAELKS